MDEYLAYLRLACDAALDLADATDSAMLRDQAHMLHVMRERAEARRTEDAD